MHGVMSLILHQIWYYVTYPTPIMVVCHLSYTYYGDMSLILHLIWCYVTRSTINCPIPYTGKCYSAKIIPDSDFLDSKFLVPQK